MTAFGLGALVGVILTYSRLHENEADRLGLTFMAMAGYDPRVAVQFWDPYHTRCHGRRFVVMDG